VVASILAKEGVIPQDARAGARGHGTGPPAPAAHPLRRLHAPGHLLCDEEGLPGRIYPSDSGCYTLGLQLGAVDTTICMGASITWEAGISHAGRPA